jgi:hypothetical protein
VKYLNGVNFLQLTLSDKCEVNNLDRTTPDLAISQSLRSKIQTYVTNVNRAIYAQRKWWSGCAERNALLGFAR